jgi:dipeptidyl aminopeptidase/acylaminoacyl peptidase
VNGTGSGCRDRSGFAFSPDGTTAACLRAGSAGRVLETWVLDEEVPDREPAPRSVPGVDVDVETCLAPLDDGRVLVLRRDAGHVPPRHRLDVLTPCGGDWVLDRLGEVPAPLGASVLASPAPGCLGVVVALEELDRSTVHRVTEEPPGLTPVVEVPGVLTGGAWLSPGVLALTATAGADRGSGVAVDLAEGTWRRIWSVSATSADRIVLADPRSGVFVVTTDAPGEERLGWGRLGERVVQFPDHLHRSGQLRRALALDDRGERLLVHEQAGAVSRLAVHTLATGEVRPVPGPLGTVGAPASWRSDLVRFPFSTPSTPPNLGSLRLAADAGSEWTSEWTWPGQHDPSGIDAALVDLPGAAGPVEAIVHGGPDWAQREHLVLALHGGPLSAWRFEHTPLLHRLAEAGAGVVALNHRGSTGYGAEHLRAVLGDWGGADLADVLSAGRAIDAVRDPALPRPVLLGGSYGAYLALLAACDEPDLWSGCVALAPFLSGPRLHAEGSAAVRHRVEQLGGLTSDRDVLRSCTSLSVPLLLVHGAGDPTVPVGQSRALARRLGSCGATNFEYREVDAGHDDVVDGRFPGLTDTVLDHCLGSSVREECTTGGGRR